MPPLIRALLIIEAGNVGLRRLWRKYASDSFSFVSSVRRSGQGTSPTRDAFVSHLHPPYAAIALTPATKNPRRDKRRTSRSTSSLIGHLMDLVSDDHRAEV